MKVKYLLTEQDIDPVPAVFRGIFFPNYSPFGEVCQDIIIYLKTKDIGDEIGNKDPWR